MAADRQTPRHGGSHFSGGATPQPSHARHTSSAQTPAPEPLSATGATAPLSPGSTGQLSSRTAEATRRAGSHTVRRAGSERPSRVPYLVAGIVAVVLVGLVALVVVPALTRGSSGGDDRQEIVAGNEVTLTIPEGSGASAIAQALYDNGVIASKSEFLAAARRTQTEASLKSGTYLLTTGADLNDILNLMAQGPNAMGDALTVPEGYTVAQVAAAAEATYGIPAADFTAQAKASNYVADFPFLADVADDSLEGYLFPKTYSLPEDNVSADALIRAMLAQYQNEVEGIDFDSAAAAIQERYGVTMNEDDFITLASIIERESRDDAEDRANVASVFYNRLQDGMLLQSDATLRYSLGRDVTADDLKNDDPYNTYTRSGLTPTPICSPSIESIKAAVEPADTDYMYFYLDGDYAAFSKTLEEHNQAIANRPQ